MIEIFKLSGNYENNNINVNEAHKLLYKKVSDINQKFSTFEG